MTDYRIRSFDNARPETIQFHTPLTLIVGSNGSGKTTIIECLKYATTGDLPPNSRGGAFIHDPTLCGEKEVLAQVKMSFNSTAQLRMVVTRSLQLSVKKTTRQQKTLEGSLLTIRHGQRQSISTRVAELDLLMPQSLGVSKAILDSVIFCHQEESLWPMSEPSVLKKKFDEIFEALKYTKAIANIKDLRKEHGRILQNLKNQEVVAKDTKARADKAEKNSKDLDSELNVLRDEISSLQADIEEAKRESADAWEHCTHYQHILDTIQLRREKQGWLAKDVQEMEASIQKRSESDEWLQAEVDNYEARVEKQQVEQETKQKEYTRISDLIRGNREQLGRRQGEMGRHEQRKTTFDAALENRRIIVRETSNVHQIRGFTSDLDDARIAEYRARIRGMLTDVQRQGRQQQETATKDAEDKRRQIQSSNMQKARLLAEQDSTRQQITRTDGDIRESRAAAHSNDGEEKSALAESRITSISHDLEELKNQQLAQNWDGILQENGKIQTAAEARVKQLNDELLQATERAGDVAQLTHLQKELGARNRDLEKLQGVYAEKIKDFLGPEDDFDTTRQDIEQQLRQEEGQRNTRQRELEHIDQQIATQQGVVKTGEERLSVCRQKLLEIVDDPALFPMELTELQEGRDTLRFDADAFDLLKRFYEEAVSTAQSGNKCRLCSRVFASTHDSSLFITAMQKKMKADQLAVIQRDLAAQEELLTKASKLQTTYDAWQSLQTEVPKSKEEYRLLEGQRPAQLRFVEEADGRISVLESKKATAQALDGPISSISRLTVEIANIEEQIRTIKEADHSPTRTLIEVRKELDQANEDFREAGSRLGTLSAERDQASKRQGKLELDLVTARGQRDGCLHALETQKRKQEQIEHWLAANVTRRAQVGQREKEIDSLTRQLETEEARLDESLKHGQRQAQILREKESNVQATVNKLDQSETSITTSSGAEEDLLRCQKDIEKLDDEVQQQEEEQKSIIKLINKIREELKSAKETKRNIEENIKLRRRSAELDEINDEISRLNAQTADVDQDNWRREADRWQRRLNKLTTEHTSKLGTARAKDDQLIRLIEDWQTEYKDAALQYKEAHIKVETTHAVVEDLGRYAGALDQAIMKYHSLKMAEINSVISELWRKTYQGTDVDDILIRSDNEGAKGNRTYNYRVSMIKQDAEMDMRGRCSAGQKVLASIIIRLALAECFGINCGLIALDEPTTNLDRDNIRSLAQALHDIIKTRRHQANFQLIVITHDEEFLRFMKCPDFCDTYWRIARNNREKSTIEQQSIGLVM